MPEVTQPVAEREGLALCSPRRRLMAHPPRERQTPSAEGLAGLCKHRRRKTKVLGSFSTVSRLWNLLTPDLALSVVVVSSLSHVQLLQPRGL